MSMSIAEARDKTGYEKVEYAEYSDGGKCYYCGSEYTRHNSMNELKTSYEYDEFNEACNKCVISMAEAVDAGVDCIVGLF